MLRADSEQGYGFARLTMRALFWKHFLIKCNETGVEKRNTDEAERPLVTRLKKKNHRQDLPERRFDVRQALFRQFRTV